MYQNSPPAQEGKLRYSVVYRDRRGVRQVDYVVIRDDRMASTSELRRRAINSLRWSKDVRPRDVESAVNVGFPGWGNK